MSFFATLCLLALIPTIAAFVLQFGNFASRAKMAKQLEAEPELCTCTLCREWMPVEQSSAATVPVEGPYGEEWVKACAMCGDRYGYVDFDIGQIILRTEARPKIAERYHCSLCAADAVRDRGDVGFPVPVCDPCDAQLTNWASSKTDVPDIAHKNDMSGRTIKLADDACDADWW